MQAADQKKGRSFVKKATYSWKTEPAQTKSSGWGGTNATCPRHLREKPSVPVLGQEDMKKNYKDIRVLGGKRGKSRVTHDSEVDY